MAKKSEEQKDVEQASFLLDPGAGGRARARSLSPERRAEIAQRAAAARWDKNVKTATYSGVLVIGDSRIDCVVIDSDEGPTRVLSQGTVLKSLGRVASMGRRGEDEKRAPFLSANNLEPYVSQALNDALVPITYKVPGQRFQSVGYRAETLPEICEVYLQARQHGKLLPSQEKAAQAAEILMRSLAKIGIAALVDEATGYEEVRARGELQLLLKAYVAESFLPWTQVFPHEFFRELYRLQGWAYKEGQTKHPGYVGKFINTYIYDQLPEGVLGELRRVNPRRESGYRARKHHQHLTVDTGNQHLDRQINAVTTLMIVSRDLDHFYELFARRFPPAGRRVLKVGLSSDDKLQTLFELEDFGEAEKAAE